LHIDTGTSCLSITEPLTNIVSDCAAIHGHGGTILKLSADYKNTCTTIAGVILDDTIIHGKRCSTFAQRRPVVTGKNKHSTGFIASAGLYTADRTAVHRKGAATANAHTGTAGVDVCVLYPTIFHGKLSIFTPDRNDTASAGNFKIGKIKRTIFQG